MRSIIRTAAVLIALVISAVQAAAIEIKEVVSPLGLKAWLVEEHAIPLIAVNFSFDPGSSADPAGKEGVAQFITAMLDEGAGDLDSAAFQAKRDELAFKMSFEADLDHFEGTFQALTKNRYASFAMLKIAITSPRFDAGPLERVRSQILVNAEQNLEDPEKILSRAWMRSAFGEHPYARERDGTPATIKTIQPDDLRAAHKRLFTRKSLRIAVVGDISPAELGPLLDATFGSLPDTAPPAAAQLVTAKAGPRVEIVDRDIPQSVIMFGNSSILRADPHFFPAYIASFILGGGGFNSRLTNEVREKRGLTYGISASLFLLDHAGVMVGQVGTRNEKAAETLQITRDTIAKFAAEGPTAEELTAAKTFITGSYALRFDSNSKIASQLLAIQQQNLGLSYITKRNSYIEAVTLEQVKEQAKRMFRADEMLIAIVGRPQGVTASGG